jgi:hypothetical protein
MEHYEESNADLSRRFQYVAPPIIVNITLPFYWVAHVKERIQIATQKPQISMKKTYQFKLLV